MTAPLEVTTDTFDEVLTSKIPVLVAFCAGWCRPCSKMLPTLDEAAAAFEERVRIVTVDTEAERQLATRFDVRALPCMAMFKDGRIVEKRTGMAPRAAIMALIERHAG